MTTTTTGDGIWTTAGGAGEAEAAVVPTGIVLPMTTAQTKTVFLHPIFISRNVQSEASYLSQNYVMFFHVSCEGLPGQ